MKQVDAFEYNKTMGHKSIWSLYRGPLRIEQLLSTELNYTPIGIPRVLPFFFQILKNPEPTLKKYDWFHNIFLRINEIIRQVV